MFIITDKDNVIMHISATKNIQEGTGYLLVDNDTLAIPTQLYKEVYEIETIPENIEPQKYCYTEEQGFYKNADYVEPPKSAEQRLAELEQTAIDNELALAELAEIILGGNQ